MTLRVSGGTHQVSKAERRAHARVAVPLRATVDVGGKSVQVAVRDISKGGAFLYCDQPPASAGETIRVTFFFPDGTSSISLDAEVVRVIAATVAEGSGVLGVGIRFTDSSPVGAAKIDELLEAALRGPGGDKRASPRIAAFLRVRCRTDEVMDAVMRDIGRGGIGLLTDRSLAIGDRVEVEVAAPNSAPISISGHVCRVDKPRPGEIARGVGVQFDELTESARSDLDHLLDSLAKG